jgi:hypothetical protein
LQRLLEEILCEQKRFVEARLLLLLNLLEEILCEQKRFVEVRLLLLQHLLEEILCEQKRFVEARLLLLQQLQSLRKEARLLSQQLSLPLEEVRRQLI